MVKVLADLRTIDEMLDDNYHILYRSESLIYDLQVKRTYLIQAIPTLWARLIKARLHAANLEMGVELIKEGLLPETKVGPDGMATDSTAQIHTGRSTGERGTTTLLLLS